MSKYTYRKAGTRYYLIRRDGYDVGAMWRERYTNDVYTSNDTKGYGVRRGPFKTLKEGLEDFDETRRQ